MKKYLILAVLVFGSYSSALCQEISKTPCIQCDSFLWKNGYDELVEVEVKNLNLTDEDITQAVFDKLGVEIMVKAKFRLKNRLSFVPKKLTLMRMSDGTLVATVLMYGKNAYGTEDEVRASYYFSSEGKILKEI